MATLQFDTQQLKAIGHNFVTWGDVFQKFKSLANREYYEFDLAFQAPEGWADINFLKSQQGLINIAKFTSSSTTVVTRNWSHIRKDQQDIYVVRFIAHGACCVTQGGRTATAAGGNFIITTSALPCRMVSRPDFGGCHETLQLMVPSHLMLGLLPNARDFCARSFSLTSTSRVAFDLAAKLLLEDGSIQVDVSFLLAKAALESLVSDITHLEKIQVLDARGERRASVLHYVDKHLSDPSLTAARVANVFSMSTRYLHLLFSDKDTLSFHQCILNKRLERARDLLADGQLHRTQVAEIAQMVGFKNPAHFSTAFRRRYGCRPMAVRRSPD